MCHARVISHADIAIRATALPSDNAPRTMAAMTVRCVASTTPGRTGADQASARSRPMSITRSPWRHTVAVVADGRCRPAGATRDRGQLSIRSRVEVSGRLVEEQHRSRRAKCARQPESLALPERKSGPAASERDVDTVRQQVEHTVESRIATSRFVIVELSEQIEVVFDRSRHDRRSLGKPADCRHHDSRSRSAASIPPIVTRPLVGSVIPRMI